MSACAQCSRRAMIPLAMRAVLLAATFLVSARPGSADDLPVRGLHLMGLEKHQADLAAKFIREDSGREGVNTLVLEFGYSFDFKTVEGFADEGAPGKAEVGKIVAACRDARIQLIPEINCLGHQSWEQWTGALLRRHREFDETPHVPADNRGIYCRSWCPLHPGVHKIVFALMDELADACEADAFHVGMDEVFLLADPKCPRCGGKAPATLFAGEVKALRDHLAAKKRTLWMWGDRFIDGKATEIGEWEASENGTAAALETAPADIVVCDWHYEKAYPTPGLFAARGLRVLACPWRKADVALAQLDTMRKLAARPATKNRALGMLQTTWVPLEEFIAAYRGEKRSAEANESADCFKKLMAAMRAEAGK